MVIRREGCGGSALGAPLFFRLTAALEGESAYIITGTWC